MHRKTSSARPANRTALSVESLDRRDVPSATWTQVGGVLTVTGDLAANTIAIVDDGTAVSVTVDGEAVALTGDVTDVVVNAGGGDDTVTYDLTGDLAAGAARTVDVSLGNGNDTFIATLGGSLLDGSSLDVNARGQNGFDALQLSAPATDVGAGSTLTVALGGGNGQDAMDVAIGGVLLGDVSVEARGGNAKDTIKTTFAFGAGSTGGVDAKLYGGNGVDTISVDGTDESGNDGDPLTEDASTLSSSVLVDGGLAPDDANVTGNMDATVVNARKHGR